MVKIAALAAALAAASALAGCATVIHGTTEQVQINSNPAGADVAIDDERHVTTPASVKLARGSSHTLVFRKSGYRDDVEHLTSTMSGWMLGNLVAGGIIGAAIDAGDGAGRKLSSDRVDVTLTPNVSAAAILAPPPADENAGGVRSSGRVGMLPPFDDDDADYAAPASGAPQR